MLGAIVVQHVGEGLRQEHAQILLLPAEVLLVLALHLRLVILNAVLLMDIGNILDHVRQIVDLVVESVEAGL